MDNFMTMLDTQIEMFIFLAIGIYCKKKRFISKNSISNFIDVILNILLPCLILTSFNQSFTMKMLKQIIILLLASLGVHLLGFLLGKLCYRKEDEEKRAVLRYGTLISNSTFTGFPMVECIYGQLGIFYAAIFLIPFRIFMWTAGISFFSTSSTKENIKKILLNPCIIAVEVGLLLMILDFHLPEVIYSPAKALGSSTTCISMIVIGAILEEVDIKSLFEKAVFKFSFIRLVVMPLITLAILKLLRIDTEIVAVTVILSAMAAGTTTSILAAKYKADAIFGAKIVFVSTIFSLITVPLITLLL